MDIFCLPNFMQMTHKGWDTQSCANTQIENALMTAQSIQAYL